MKSNLSALKTVEAAIKTVNKEINNLELKKDDPIYERQLKKTFLYLHLMKQKLNGEEPITDKDKHGYGIGRMIVDSWSYDNPLGEPVISAEDDFIKAINNN